MIKTKFNLVVLQDKCFWEFAAIFYLGDTGGVAFLRSSQKLSKLKVLLYSVLLSYDSAHIFVRLSVSLSINSDRHVGAAAVAPIFGPLNSVILSEFEW